jgi:hypothetical protein
VADRTGQDVVPDEDGHTWPPPFHPGFGVRLGVPEVTGQRVIVSQLEDAQPECTGVGYVDAT